MPALPEPLFNTYTQYKSDTLKIATWLATTAKRCGYTGNVPPATPGLNSSAVEGNGGDGKPAKLKGRARKLAKEAAAREANEVKEAEKKRESSGDVGGVKEENAEKQGTKEVAQAEKPVEEKKYVIQLREFVPMAETIAKATSASNSSNGPNGDDGTMNANVRVSTGLIKLFRRCIRARTGTLHWYESQGNGEGDGKTGAHGRRRYEDDSSDDEDGGDDGHGHFIKVLRQALNVLVPVHELQELEARDFKIAKARRNGLVKNNEIFKVTNAFGQLEIEENDDDAFEALPSVNMAPSRETSKSKESVETVKYEVEDDGEEWLFALNCLWDDIHEIQHYLKGMWLIYSKGQADLATVSVVTNTAIDLVRRAEEDFNNAGLKLPEPYKMPHIDGHLCSLYFMEACIRDGLGPPRESRESIIPLSAWDQAEESFLLVYRLLQSSTDNGPKKRTIPITRPGWLGTYDPALDRDMASEKRLLEQDAGLLMDMIVTIGPYSQLAKTPNDDELMKGMRDHVHTETPPLWLVFAGQVFLDAHEMLKTKGEQPFEDLYQYALEARRTLRGYDKFFDKHELTGFQTEQSRTWVREVHTEIETWALNDKILQIFNEEMSVRKQLQSNKRTGSKKVRPWKENEILKMNPILCGMWKYCFQLQMQLQGIRLVNETMIMAAVHLYNALQQGGYIPEDCLWVDAEYLLDIHREANTFLGERPKTIEECTKRLAVSQGVSPTTFARGRRQGAGNHRVVFSKSGGKFLRQSTPVAGVFKSRFLEDGSVDLSLGNIETILGRRLDQRRERRKLFSELGLDQNTFEAGNKMREIMGLDPLTLEEWEEIQKEDEAATKESDHEDSSAEAMMLGPNESHQATNCACGKEHESMDWDEAEHETLDRWEKEHKLSLCDFVSELSESLREEELDVEFDYFAFHRSTWRLLEAIQQRCLPLVLPYVEEEWLGEVLHSDEGTTVVPALIMLAACDSRQNLNIMNLKPSINVDDRGLVAAAEIMKDFIEREGASFSKKEKTRLAQRSDLEWETGDATGPGDGLFSGAVGNIADVSATESARILRGMTMEDAWTREDQRVENEPEEKKKKKKSKSKKKKKKPAKEEETEGLAIPSDVLQERVKEDLQPQVEDESVGATE